MAYSQDWRLVGAQIRAGSNYCCQRCGLQCLRPGESVDAPLQMVLPLDELTMIQMKRSEAYRRRLQVHHRDRDTTNNDPANLEALCPACHIDEHRSDRRNQPPVPGQLSLF